MQKIKIIQGIKYFPKEAPISTQSIKQKKKKKKGLRKYVMCMGA